jgi:ankyrin repeat protein
VIAFLLGSELFRKMARHYYGSLLPDGDNDDGTGEPIIRNSQCVTALSYACERGHVGTVQVIVQSVRHRRLAGWLEDEDMDDDRPLDCAVVRGHVDVAAVLVRANASLDLDFERSTGSVLARAVHGGHVAAVQFLLDAKAVLCDAKAAVHGTHAWSGCQDRRIVRLLVRAKADVRSFACCRPVTAAAKHGTHDDRNEDV